MSIHRPLALCGALFFIALFCAASAQAQTYRVLVGYPPGGVQDQQARVLAEKLREGTGHAFIAETRAGATGQLAVDELLRAPADGLTLLMTTDSNVAIYPATVKKRSYTPADFAPIAHTGDYRMALAVGTGVPVSDLKSFVTWSQGAAGPVGYGTPGAGSILHFYGILIAQVTGARLTHVPYKGTGPAITDLTGGHVPAAVVPLGSLLPHAKAGKVRILGQTGDGRADASDVPTFRELGFGQLAASGWYGLFARAGTPPEVVSRYHDIVVKSLGSPEGAKRMRDWQLEPRSLTPAQFMDLVRADTQRWAAVVKASGFTLESE
jgi:tripartite-type tricarboxylate transporter receptor subunit TctC